MLVLERFFLMGMVNFFIFFGDLGRLELDQVNFEGGVVYPADPLVRFLLKRVILPCL